MTGQSKESRLHAKNLAFAYRKSAPALKRITADITPGSLLAILGKNGSGKSTLLACLNAMLKPQAGIVTLDDLPLEDYSPSNRARRIGLVEQAASTSSLSVYDTLLLGRKPHSKTAPNRNDHDATERVIKQLDLSHLALRPTNELSGGERQKVILGRTFVQETGVLLLDEPTSNLDPANQIEAMQLIRAAVNERRLAAAAVMHDMNLALRYCDRFLLLKDGEVIAYGDTTIITSENIHTTYGIEVDIIAHNEKLVIVPR